MRFILLDSSERYRDHFGKRHTLVCSDTAGVVAAVRRATKDALWISPRSEKTEMLLRAIEQALMQSHVTGGRLGNLLMLEFPRPESLPILHSCFRKIVGESPAFRTLPIEELAQVLCSPSDVSRDRFLGGAVDRKSNVLALTRGNLETITVPLSFFRSSGLSKPDPRRLSLCEHGHVIRLGDYEAAADAVLYEFDSEFRRRLNARRREQDKGFGPSLRRLRIQRRLTQGDFAPLAAKTIARLERGEVEAPHGKTLRLLARRLGVSPDQIETY